MNILVTGRSGSGKSTFAQKLSQALGFEYIDIDKVGHSLYQDKNILEKTRQLFGDGIFDDGVFNRKKLGKIIFSEQGSERIKLFNDLTWSYMQDIIDKKIEQHGNVVLDWILLPTTKYWNWGERILVKADKAKRFEKIKQRDNVSEDYIEAREKAAIVYFEGEFDFVVENDFSDKLQREVARIANIISNEVEK